MLLDIIKYFIVIFVIGCYGIFIYKRHFILILIALELILLCANMIFIITSAYIDDIVGQLFSLIILTVAAAEISIGLALTIVFYRLLGGITIDLISLLKG